MSEVHGGIIYWAVALWSPDDLIFLLLCMKWSSSSSRTPLACFHSPRGSQGWRSLWTQKQPEWLRWPGLWTARWTVCNRTAPSSSFRLSPLWPVYVFYGNNTCNLIKVQQRAVCWSAPDETIDRPAELPHFWNEDCNNDRTGHCQQIRSDVDCWTKSFFSTGWMTPFWWIRFLVEND